MLAQNQNFEPIYAALTALLINSATVSFTADATDGSPILASVPPDLPLTTGLAVQGGTLPIGLTIQATTTNTIILTGDASGTQSGAAFTAGYASTDPVAARILRHWSDVPASEQPALFVTQIGELGEKRVGQLEKWTLDVLVYVYCQGPNDRTPVAPTLNALLGAIRGSMGCDASGRGRAMNANTLSGLVFDTWINGKIETDEGVLGQQGVAKIPIRIIQNGP